MPYCMDGRTSEARHDFALVTTYLPIVGLTLRASMLICIIFWCLYTVRLPFSAVLMVSCSLVYVDSLLLGTQHFDRACGHLCLCALAVLTQQHELPCSDSRAIVQLIVDLLWSVFASAEVVSQTTLMRTHLPLHVKLGLGCIFASAHVIFTCAALSFLETLLRGTLYYVLCSLVVLCKPLSHVDRRVDSALHLCVPVLFVHLYPLVASVLVIVCTHARLIYVNTCMHAGARTQLKSPLTPSPVTPQKEIEHPDLFLQLQAAKRAHGMV